MADIKNIVEEIKTLSVMELADLVHAIEEDFQRTLERSRPITAESIRVRGCRRVVNALLRLIAPLM